MYSTRVTRWVRAAPATVYRALLDPYAVAAWRVPDGMTSTIQEFDGVEGGRFRVSLRYDVEGAPGQSVERTDSYAGRFTRLVPDRLVEESLEFASTDPAYAGVVKVTTELRPVDGGCEVVLAFDGIPDAIDPGDSELASQLTLVRLAAWVEDRRW